MLNEYLCIHVYSHFVTVVVNESIRKRGMAIISQMFIYLCAHIYAYVHEYADTRTRMCAYVVAQLLHAMHIHANINICMYVGV